MLIAIGLMFVLAVTPIIVIGIIDKMLTLDVLIFLLIPEIIGLALIFIDIKFKIKRNKIKKYGIVCYGAVNEIKKIPSEFEEDVEYKAVIKMYNPEKNICEDIEKKCEKDTYQINSFLIGKNYSDKTYIEDTIPSSEVPEDIKIKLFPTPEQINNMNVEMSLDKEYVFINNTRYKKI